MTWRPFTSGSVWWIIWSWLDSMLWVFQDFDTRQKSAEAVRLSTENLNDVNEIEQWGEVYQKWHCHGELRRVYGGKLKAYEWPVAQALKAFWWEWNHSRAVFTFLAHLPFCPLASFELSRGSNLLAHEYTGVPLFWWANTGQATPVYKTSIK